MRAKWINNKKRDKKFKINSVKTKGQHKLAMGTNVWLQRVKSRLLDGKIRLHALLLRLLKIPIYPVKLHTHSKGIGSWFRTT